MIFFLRAAMGAASLFLATAPALAAEPVSAGPAAATPPAAALPLAPDLLQTLIRPASVAQSTPTALPALTLTAKLPAAPVPLRSLVIAFVDRGDADAEQDCLARAVYFEARSEPLEGQLAVAQVILNRAASGAYPTTVCEVVTQPAQFSFVRRGKLPAADKASDCWHRALAIADIARKRTTAGEIASNVLWYHATYVSPSWGRQRTRFAQIGRHIFFS